MCTCVCDAICWKDEVSVQFKGRRDKANTNCIKLLNWERCDSMNGGDDGFHYVV